MQEGAIALAYRRLALTELVVVAGLTPEITQAAVDECASFLTIKEDTLYLIYQSAKDYLLKDLEKSHGSKLQNGGAIQGHADISTRSIEAMRNILTENIYALPHGAFEVGDVTVPIPDPLEGLQYSCVYWIQHVCQVCSQPDLYQPDVEIEEVASFLHDKSLVHVFLEKHSLSLARGFKPDGKIP